MSEDRRLPRALTFSRNPEESRLPQFITFTGSDDHTDIEAMATLSDEYPIEWGVLIGGRLGSARYPSPRKINEISEWAQRPPYRAHFHTSLHLCGPYAQTAMKDLRLPEEQVDLRGFPRIQVNALTYDMKALGKLAEKYRKEIIFQHRDGPFSTDLPSGVVPLHDKSGGKGVVASERPGQAPVALAPYPVGYAGGFRPENIIEILQSISAYNYWLDMETGVRTDDRFDLLRCEAVCKFVYSDNGPRSIQRFMTEIRTPAF